jgi:outer membrane protein assembly factor BamB
MDTTSGRSLALQAWMDVGCADRSALLLSKAKPTTNFELAGVFAMRLFGCMTVLRLATFAALFIASIANAGDLMSEKQQNWHQWRGPDGTGVATAAQPPLKWDDKTNIKWKVSIPGKGKSTPIIWGNKVFVLSAVDTQKVVPSATKPEEQPERKFGIKFPNTIYRFVVLCLNRDTGAVLWERTAIEELPHEGHHGDNSFASASPMTDGKNLYVSFGSRGFFCYDLDGNLKWKRDLEDVETRLSFGEGSSPVVHDDIVVLNRDNEGKSQIVAFNANTGAPLWQAARTEESAWATPLVVEHAGTAQVITSASNRVRSYDLRTGKIIWECGGQVGNVIPSPVRWGDYVICMSGYRGTIAMAIPLDSRGDVTDSPKISWKYDKDTPYVPSPVLYGDLLCFNKSNSGILTCLDVKTGKAVTSASRIAGLANVYASPVGAADRIYYVGRDGTTVVLNRESMTEVLATNLLNESIDASPAIAGKQMFLRGAQNLYCLEEK